jgi:hypothetical protein
VKTMSTNVSRKLTLIITIAVLLGANAFGSDERSQLQTVSMCELVNNWKAYQGREVQVRAIYTEEKVQERLYDPSCAEIRGVAVKWPPHLSKAMKRATGKLDRLVAKDRQKRAWVVVEGVFYGPEPYKETEIPANLPPTMKEQMRKSHKRYGYMDGFDNMIEITKVVEASAVAAEVPGPSQASQSGSGTTLLHEFQHAQATHPE